MNLFTAASSSQQHSLTETYRPHRIEDFIGLEKPKRIVSKLATNPIDLALLFVGDPGLGKTTLGLTLAEVMPAELHHVPSQDCNLETLRNVIASCQYVPRTGCRKHLVLVDEADQMTKAAQLYLLSKLDATSFPPDTIFIFTCNSTDGLEERFLSRCSRVEFSSYGNSRAAAELLEHVWNNEAPANTDAPDFARLVKNAKGNVRASLMDLQNELLLA